LALNGNKKYDRSRPPLKQRADGRYRLNFTIEDPLTCEKKSQTMYGYSQREVYDKRDAVYETIEQGLNPNSKPTVRDYAKEWLAVYKAHISHRYRRQLRYEINRICTVIGDKRIDTVIGLDIRKVYNTRIGDSSSAIRTMETTLKGIFKAAYADRLITFDPCVGIAPPPGTTETHAHKYIPPDMVELIVKTAEGHRYGPVAALMACTGMRPGEAYAFDPSLHVDWEKRRLYVVRSFKEAKRRGTYELTEGTKDTSGRVRRTRTRIIAMVDILEPILRGRSGCMLTQEDGSQITEYYVGKTFDSYLNYLVACGLGAGYQWTAYDLRITFASLSKQAGVSVEATSDDMGHQDVTLTQNIYIQVTEALRKEEDEKRNKLYSQIVNSPVTNQPTPASV